MFPILVMLIVLGGEVDDNYGFLDAVLAQVTLGICKETGKIFQFFVVFPVFPVFFLQISTFISIQLDPQMSFLMQNSHS